MLTAKSSEDDRVTGLRIGADDYLVKPFSPREFDLVAALASRPGRVFSRYELVTRVQGYDYEGYKRTIDAHVKNLRRKLGEDPKSPRYVVTVAGVGYKFGVKADA